MFISWTCLKLTLHLQEDLNFSVNLPQIHIVLFLNICLPEQMTQKHSECLSSQENINLALEKFLEQNNSEILHLFISGGARALNARLS